MSFSKLVTLTEICDEFNCNKYAVKRMIKKEGFPKPVPFRAREPIFEAEDVNDWIGRTYGDYALEVLFYFRGRAFEEINNETSD